ncbi:MAG: hypothetical protein JWR03_642 [Cohnella sp.]|jgi:regulatory protein YycI of two-component signal transduction system YycFG|nr:hypothetical protein [Cohnella sp.]
MDWRRAKSVLIIAFLLLNALLGYQLWTEWRAQLNSSVDRTSLPAVTRQIMQEKKIRIDSTIPAGTPSMRDLSFLLKQPSSGKNGRTPIASPPETRVVFNPKELADALSGVIPEIGKYAYDNAGSREGVFVLNRMNDGYPMFDIHLELYNSDQKIRAYRQDVIQILTSEGSTAQQVLPASKAVATLIDKNQLPAGSAIKDIRLGYHGQFFDTDEQLSAPSWRVLLESGEVYYVHAISGEVDTGKGPSTVHPAESK